MVYGMFFIFNLLVLSDYLCERQGIIIIIIIIKANYLFTHELSVIVNMPL
jgi:hypothetical protein